MKGVPIHRFANHTVIVTGAGSGIGESTARRFSPDGAAVALAGDHGDELERVARDLPADRTLVHVVDVSKHDPVEALVDAAVKRFGRLDVLVNNAGIAPDGKVTEASLDDWERTMAVNVGGAFHGARAATPHSSKAAAASSTPVRSQGWAATGG